MQIYKSSFGEGWGSAGFACVMGSMRTSEDLKQRFFRILSEVTTYLEIQDAETSLGDLSLFLILSIYVAWTLGDRNLNFSYVDHYSPLVPALHEPQL